jgi:hypothetical protein
VYFIISLSSQKSVASMESGDNKALLAISLWCGVWLFDADHEYKAFDCLLEARPQYFTFSPNNMTLAVDIQGVLQFWDMNIFLSEGAEAAGVACLQITHAALDCSLERMYFSPSGDKLMLTGHTLHNGRNIVMLEFPSLQVIWRKDNLATAGDLRNGAAGDLRNGYRFIFSANSNRFLFKATGDSFCWANSVDASSNLPLAVVGGGFDLSPSENDVAFVSTQDGPCTLCVVSLETGSLKCEILLHRGMANADWYSTHLVLYCGSDSKVVVGSNCGLVRMWNIDSKTLMWQAGEMVSSATRAVRELAYFPQRDHIAVSTVMNTETKIFDATAGTLVCEVKGDTWSLLRYTNCSTTILM